LVEHILGDRVQANSGGSISHIELYQARGFEPPIENQSSFEAKKMAIDTNERTKQRSVRRTEGVIEGRSANYLTKSKTKFGQINSNDIQKEGESQG
jgi:hypothetical protein